MITRRGFLQSVLALGVAPYIGKASALMKSPTFAHRLPLIFGMMRVPGHVVYCEDLVETVTNFGTNQAHYGYSASFDVLPWADGFVDIRRLFFDGRVIWEAGNPPMFERTPAGLLRFKDLPLADFCNRTPPIDVEVVR